MNYKLISSALLIPGLFAVFPATVCAQGPPGFDQPEPPAESKPAPRPRPRWPRPLQLPDQYRSRDIDRDGQIGVYEWPRTDIATFRRLDLNRDGFLTPQELAPRSSFRSPPLAPAASTSEVARTPPPASPTTAPASPPPAGDPPPPSAGSRSESDRFFELMDKDKNGKVTEEEFKKSILMSRKFADAGIALTFPVNREEFARQYPQPAGASR